jgi:hypothetical protein
MSEEPKSDVPKIPEAEDKLSQQALGPAAREFGRKVAPLGAEAGHLTLRVGLALIRSLKPLVHGWEKLADWIEQEMTKRLKDVPREKIVPPEPRIAVPALQALTYSLDDELIPEMFANLLAADMNVDRKGDAHPAFVEIIKEMTPADARVLMSVRDANKEVEFTVRVGSPHAFWTLATRYSFEIEGLSASECEKSLSNLQRLGLVEAREEFPTSDKHNEIVLALKKEFEPAKNDSEARARAAGDGIGIGIDVRRRGLYPTPLGQGFVKVCMTTEKNT